MAAAEDLARVVGTAPACAALTVSRASLYRRRRPTAPPRPRPTPARALRVTERQAVCDVLHADRFVDKAPAHVYAALLDEGTY
jgi:putative transposase